MDKSIDRWHHVVELVSRIAFPGYEFHVRHWVTTDLTTVHVHYRERDVMNGAVETQHGRRWIIEPDATDMAIVQTCFKALMTSLEHRGREHFTLDGKALLQPHHTLESLLSIAPERNMEASLESIGIDHDIHRTVRDSFDRCEEPVCQ